MKELQGYKEEPVILRNTVYLVRITISMYVCMHVRTCFWIHFSLSPSASTGHLNYMLREPWLSELGSANRPRGARRERYDSKATVADVYVSGVRAEGTDRQLKSEIKLSR